MQIVLCYWIKLNLHLILFLICVQKTISMKILVLCVITSSRHRKCFVRGFMHSLFVSKALTRSYLARSGFWHKQLVNKTPNAALSMTLTISTVKICQINIFRYLPPEHQGNKITSHWKFWWDLWQQTFRYYKRFSFGVLLRILSPMTTSPSSLL